jgi:hypothetical protein
MSRNGITVLKSVEPVILSDSILAEAESWRDELLTRVPTEPADVRIDDKLLTFNGKQRRVALFIVREIQDNVEFWGKCEPKIRSKDGRAEEGGNTVLIPWAVVQYEKGRVFSHAQNVRDMLMPNLLHEITHAIDPLFDEYCLNQKTKNTAQPMSRREYYLLPVERRAFTAMCTSQIRRELIDFGYLAPEDAIESCCQEIYTFRGFCDEVGADLYPEIVNHFRIIIEDLRQRRGKA